MSESKEQNQQSSDFPTAGYEAAEEERQSLKEEGHNAHLALLEEERQSPQPAKQQKRGESKGKRRPTTTIGEAASAWQVTLFDLDKQLNRQRTLMERMADDIQHMRKQFNQVQRDLAKFEKRMGKMKSTTTSSSAKGESEDARVFCFCWILTIM
jgi:hypothetical protein